MTNEYISSFCMEMYLILKSGIGASDGLGLLFEEEKDPDIKEAIGLVYEKAEEGASLFDAMSAPQVFPKYMLDMVKTGEKTGYLDAVFNSLAGYYKRRERIARTIKGAVAYPAMLFFMVIVVVAVLLTEVLPVFGDIFKSLGAEMDPLANGFMRVGMALRSARIPLFALLFALFLGGALIYLIPPARKWFMNKLEDLFSKGRLAKKIGAAQLSSVMSMALSSGMDIDLSLEMAQNLASQKQMRDKIVKCRERIREGASFPEAVGEAELFEPLYCRMLAVGIRTGSTDAVMLEIAERSADAMERAIEGAAAKIEPSLVIAMSLIIGAVILSVMLPLMGVMSAIG